MDADSIKIECEEDGFYLLIDTDPDIDLRTGMLRLRITDPEALYDHVKAAILPWLMERDQAKREFERMKRTGDTRGLSDEEFSAYLDDAYGDNWSKRVGMEQAREGGYA